MSNLRSRIERLEKRIAIDEKVLFTLEELYHFMKLSDPEGFRRDAMDPRCPNQRWAQQVLDTPTPKRMLRQFRRAQLGLLRWPEALLKSGETAHMECESAPRLASPEESHETQRSPLRKEE